MVTHFKDAPHNVTLGHISCKHWIDVGVILIEVADIASSVLGTAVSCWPQ